MIDGKKLIALCTYRIYDSQLFSFITEFNKLLNANNCCLFIYALNSELGNSGESYAEISVFDLIPYDKTDAVIIMDEKIKSRDVVQSIIDKATQNGVPSIVIDGTYEDASLVRFDYVKGFESVVRHIIEYHGVRKPHFMAGKRHSPFSNDRIEVFKKVIAENGIEYDNSMLSYGDFWAVPARAATKQLLKRDELPEAIICANDIMAINVCDVLQAAGVRVPEDVIVSGFDGVEEAFWSKPGITTAQCDSMELASMVMDVVLSLFEGKEKVIRWITPGFIANDSCGCPRCDQDLLSAVNGLNNRFYHHQDDIHIMQGLTSKIMSGKNVEESLGFLRNQLTEDMFIVVEKSCFDLENNFFFDDVPKGEQALIYDAYSQKDGLMDYDPSTIVPHLSVILDKGYPLLFNALEYMGKAPGFVCYSYPRFEIVDYSKTPFLTNCLGMAIGGYVINKYQMYLREKIQRMYQNDALTGLYNRLAFLAKYDELLEDPSNEGKKVTLFMADLNGLKQINDSMGHLAGDKAIACVAEAMRMVCPQDALCARIGGDEMMSVVLGDCNPVAVKERIEAILHRESMRLGYTVSASIGVYETVFDKYTDLNQMIGYADAEMYKIKRNYNLKANA